MKPVVFSVLLSEAGVGYAVHADDGVDRTELAVKLYDALFQTLRNPEEFVARLGADPDGFLREIQRQIERDRDEARSVPGPREVN